MKLIPTILTTLRTGGESFSRGLLANITALSFVLGLGLLSAGLWLAWPPLGLIGPGVVLIAVSVFGGGGSKPK